MSTSDTMPDIALGIIEESLNLVKALKAGNLQNDAEIAASIARLIGGAERAFEDSRGRPLDPNLIRPETI
jgi:hypothetical protein